MNSHAESYIMLLTVTYPHELAVIQARFEAEDIKFIVENEHITQVNPLYSTAVGGVKLRVLENDFQRAEAILKEDNSKEIEVLPTESANESNEIKCPSCGSYDVSKPRLSPAVFAISFLLLGFPLPFMSKTCHCFDCRLDFKKK